MAYNITIIGSSLIVSDTSDSSIKFEAPKKDVYFSNTDLNNDKIQLYDTNGIYQSGAKEFSCQISEAQIDGVAATKANSRIFQRNSLGVSVCEMVFSGAALDKFGRLPTADPGNRLDVEFTYDKQSDLIDEILSGVGTVTHNINTKDISLKVIGAGVGDSAGVASHPVPYTPGNAQLVEITGALNAANIAGGSAEVFLRSKITGSVEEQVFTQAAGANQWNGSDVSDVDWSKSQIFEMDFQSLKVGQVSYYLNRKGKRVNIHNINNDNIRTSGYWQSPSLPVCWKIYNDATYTYAEILLGNDDNGIGFRYKVPLNAGAELRAICATVKSGGGESLQDIDGLHRAADMGVASKSVSTTLIPLISIRSKSTFKAAPNLSLAIPLSVSLQADNPIRYVVLHNSVLTGAVWADVDANESAIEYDVAASAVANGHAEYSDYLGTSKNSTSSLEALLGKALMWSRKGSETGILTIAAERSDTTNADALATIRFKEIK